MGLNIEKDALVQLVKSLKLDRNNKFNNKYEKIFCEMMIENGCLPKNMRPSKEIWEQVGFTFTDIPGDDLLYKVTLPFGWKIKNISHTYKEIIDENGYLRATMSLNVGLDKKDLNMILIPRFSCGEYFIDSSNEKVVYFGNINEIIYVADVINRSDPNSLSRWYYAYDKAEKYGLEYYPDYKNPLAYWDILIKDKQPKLDNNFHFDK